jgi:sialidase-1
VTPAGTVLAFCEGRKANRADHGDVDLVLKRSNDGGRSWGPLELVYEEGGTAKTTIGNPCPVVDATTRTIWLPFCRDNDGVFVTHSSDDGKTWSKAVDITADVKRPDWSWYATGPGVGIQLQTGPHRGRLVIPCDHREKINGQDVMFSHVFYSDDHGQSWKLGGSVDRHTDECQVAELNDGRLMINMRNYWGKTAKVKERGGMRAVAFSTDGGTSWSPLEFHRALVEPICQASLLRVNAQPKGASRLLFSNPASATERRNLTVRLSEDDGRTWAIAKVLHEGPSAYSCLTVLPDRTIGCLFEAGRDNAYERIVFARFSPEWLTGR